MQKDKPQYPKLMQLSIPRGWIVGDNKFYDTDPVKSIEEGSDFITNAIKGGFIEDTLWLFEWRYEKDRKGRAQLIIPKTNHYSIDLGWYPDSSMTGQYLARLYWNSKDHPIEVESFASKNRFAIRDRIEQWMDEIITNYQESHSRFL